jgi:hypothetical protein
MEKFFGPYLKKKKSLKLKYIYIYIYIGLINFFLGPYLLGALGNGLSGLAIGPALEVLAFFLKFFFY